MAAFFLKKISNAKKRQSSHQCLFARLGSACAKAARKMLVKLTPGVNFTNVLCAAFTLVGHENVENTVTS